VNHAGWNAKNFIDRQSASSMLSEAAISEFVRRFS
jgi:hypothetical protein